MHITSAVLASLLAGLGSCNVVKRGYTAVDRPVFAHYMIGEINPDHVLKDIRDAKAIGIDGFAMNFDRFEGWSNNTVDRLFAAADSEGGFGLFFSFDHGAGFLGAPTTYASYLMDKTKHNSYYFYKNKPLVSTFGGEDINWLEFKKAADVILIPGFYNDSEVPSTTYFNNRPNLNGIFNWNSWPRSNAGRIAVSSADDAKFNTAAHDTGRYFMMGVSPVQFKHISDSFNWYRRGEDNLENRLGQVLSLQPDMVQLQSWNDAGEGHYMGNIWPEPMHDAKNIQALVNGYDHTGYKETLRAFVLAYKRGDKTTANMVPTNGKMVQGTFWHHTLTNKATCNPADPIIKAPDVTNLVEDVVSGVVLVDKNKSNLVAVVKVGNTELPHVNLKPGFNKFKIPFTTTGAVQIEVWDVSTMVGGGYGTLSITNSGPLCNYNFQVVGFPN